MELSEKRRDQGSMYLPEEVVAEILRRLPMGPLLRQTIVSKLWKSIISHPKFGKTYLQLPRPPASFQLWQLLHYDDYIYILKYLCNDTQFCVNIGPAQHLLSYVNGLAKNGAILASSNGLILSYPFGSHPRESYLMKLELFISNPLNKQSVQLPCLRGPFSRKCVLGFATSHPAQPGAFIVYKVVFIQGLIDRPVVAGSVDSAIQIFSSDSGSWTGEQLISCPEVVFKCRRRAPFTCKGILHWCDENTRTIVTYDPYGSPDRFGLVHYPKGSSKGSMGMIGLGDEDMLKYGEIKIKREVTGASLIMGWMLRVWRLVDHHKGEWWLERICLIRPKENLRPSSRIHNHRFSSQDLWIQKFHGCLFEVSTDPSEPMQVFVGLNTPSEFPVPVVSCPWASPFYGESG